MTKLVRNEFKKINKFKIFCGNLLFVLAVYLINKLDYSKDSIYSFIPFVMIFISIYYSGIISNEIENGSIRFYLTKPYKRWKIYLSKYITILISSIISLLIILLSFYFIYGDIDKAYIVKYIKYSCPILVLCSIIIFNSTIIKNTSIALGINIFIIVFGVMISEILFGLELTFIEYSFLPYMDFTIFNNMSVVESINNEFSVNLSIKSGIYINLLYSLILYLLGNIIFVYKDIKN